MTPTRLHAHDTPAHTRYATPGSRSYSMQSAAAIMYAHPSVYTMVGCRPVSVASPCARAFGERCVRCVRQRSGIHAYSRVRLVPTLSHLHRGWAHPPRAPTASEAQCEGELLERLEPGKEYLFKVRAVNANGPSEWSRPTRPLIVDYTVRCAPPAAARLGSQWRGPACRGLGLR